MVHPHDQNGDEARHEREERGPLVDQAFGQRNPGRGGVPEVQREQRDREREDAVAEGLHPRGLFLLEALAVQHNRLADHASGRFESTAGGGDVYERSRLARSEWPRRRRCPAKNRQAPRGCVKPFKRLTTTRSANGFPTPKGNGDQALRAREEPRRAGPARLDAPAVAMEASRVAMDTSTIIPPVAASKNTERSRPATTHRDATRTAATRVARRPTRNCSAVAAGTASRAETRRMPTTRIASKTGTAV